jgi:hypothetical protein
MLVQKSGDLPAERRRLQQFPDRAGGVEDLALQRLRECVPLHDDRRAKASQDVLLFGRKGQAASAMLFCRVYGAVVVISQPLLVIGER